MTFLFSGHQSVRAGDGVSGYEQETLPASINAVIPGNSPWCDSAYNKVRETVLLLNLRDCAKFVCLSKYGVYSNNSVQFRLSRSDIA